LITDFISVKPITLSIKVTLKDFENAAICLVTVDGRPFTAVEDESFQWMTRKIISANNELRNTDFQTYQMHRHKVKELMQQRAKEVRNHITKMLSNKIICLKIDCATRLERSFIGINGQVFIDGKLQLFTLGVIELKERHTADYLKKVILDVLLRYKISINNVYAITTDNGANLLKCVKIVRSDDSEGDQLTQSQPGMDLIEQECENIDGNYDDEDYEIESISVVEVFEVEIASEKNQNNMNTENEEELENMISECWKDLPIISMNFSYSYSSVINQR